MLIGPCGAAVHRQTSLRHPRENVGRIMWPGRRDVEPLLSNWTDVLGRYDGRFGAVVGAEAALPGEIWAGLIAGGQVCGCV